jgi:predicted O-methyltransferase YrrM
LLQTLKKIFAIVNNKTLSEARRLETIETNFSKADNLRNLSLTDLLFFLNSDKLSQEWGRISHGIQELKLPESTGGINPGDQRAIFYLTRAINANSVLEIGSHIGCSTIILALALEQNLKENKIDALNRMTSVDIKDVNDPIRQPWKAFDSPHSPKKILELIGCDWVVEFVTEDSLSFLSKCQKTFDFIFLDGSHLAGVVYQETPHALRLLNPGGLILLHDYFPDNQPLWSNGYLISGPYLAVERLKQENLNLDILPLGDLPWPTKLDSHKTSLALLIRKI